jgi:hypothetical protein
LNVACLVLEFSDVFLPAVDDDSVSEEDTLSPAVVPSFCFGKKFSNPLGIFVSQVDNKSDKLLLSYGDGTEKEDGVRTELLSFIVYCSSHRIAMSAAPEDFEGGRGLRRNEEELANRLLLLFMCRRNICVVIFKKSERRSL